MILHLYKYGSSSRCKIFNENPSVYVTTNIVGFSNILEISSKNNVKHFIYASSSSVYGGNLIHLFRKMMLLVTQLIYMQQVKDQ